MSEFDAENQNDNANKSYQKKFSTTKTQQHQLHVQAATPAEMMSSTPFINGFNNNISKPDMSLSDFIYRTFDLNNYQLFNTQWINNNNPNSFQNNSANYHNELSNNSNSNNRGLQLTEIDLNYILNCHAIPSLPLMTNLMVEQKATDNNMSMQFSIDNCNVEKGENTTSSASANEINWSRNNATDVMMINPTDNNNLRSDTTGAKNSSRSNGRLCTVCGKSFKYPSDLKKHILIHNGPREYTCEVCDKSFRREHQLIVHKRIHTGEKPFLCQYCGASFRHDSTYSLHIRAKHDNIKPFFCEKCNKTFGRIAHLKKHQKNACKGKKSMELDNNVGTSILTDNLIDNVVTYATTTSNGIPNGYSVKSENINYSSNSDSTTKKSITIRCQYCLKDFQKTIDLRQHLNSAGNCNNLYLMELKRKENKFNSIEFSKCQLTPISMENKTLLNHHTKFVTTVPTKEDHHHNNHGQTTSIPLHQFIMGTNENPNNRMMMMVDNDRPHHMDFNSTDNVSIGTSQHRRQPPTTITYNDPNTHIPYNPLMNVPSCYASSGLGDCMTNNNNNNNNTTTTTTTINSNNLFENIVPNNIFFDNQVFDLFKDIDFQTNPTINKPTNFDSKPPSSEDNTPHN